MAKMVSLDLTLASHWLDNGLLCRESKNFVDLSKKIHIAESIAISYDVFFRLSSTSAFVGSYTKDFRDLLTISKNRGQEVALYSDDTRRKY